jgi:hypothetical protein
MPREIAMFDALVPTLLFAFVIASLLTLMLDWLLTRFRIYSHVWYPALFRLSIFICLFAGIGLWIY